MALWPEPPAEITFPPGKRPPVWCAVQAERDIDNATFYHFGHSNSYRKIANAWQLETYVSLGGDSAADLKAAKKLLAVARQYEADREAAIDSSGYGQADGELNHAHHRVDRIARLVFKCEAKTSEGLAIKAAALIVVVNARDQNLAYQSKLLYAEALARDVVRLSSDHVVT